MRPKLVFFDLETGGLDETKHPITQIAAAAVDQGTLAVLDTFERLVQFDISEAEPEALKLNHFDPERWAAKALPKEAVCDELSKFFKKHATFTMISKKTTRPYYVARLIGHNAAKFDGPFLQAWYKKQDQFMPAAYNVLCTCQRAQFHFLEHGNPPEDFKLGTLCAHFGIDLNEAHDALSDVLANVELYKCILEVAKRKAIHGH